MAKKTSTSGIEKILKKLGIKENNKGSSTGSQWFSGGENIESYSPTDGNFIAKVKTSTTKDYEKVIETAQKAFQEFRLMPAPKRGELVRQFGNKLRENKEDLGRLVSYEMGKSLQEGLGEVQEMIDICDFAVGLPGSCMVLPCTPRDRGIVCMSSITQWELWGLFLHSTFLWRFGRGILLWHGFVAMLLFGNLRPKSLCVL